MRNFIFLLSFWLFFSCSDQLQTNGTPSPDTDLLEKAESELNTDFKADFQDSFILDTAYIEGTELWMEVSYGGGCQEHDFMVVWPEVITMIYPPDFGVTLYHNSNGDNCRAFISDTIKADLRETPTGNFDAETISQMRITVVNGSKMEEKKSTR